MINLDWAKCGTEANYRAHLRRNEKPCDACRLANNRAVVDRRRRYSQESLPPDDPRHGTLTGYNVRRCKCEACTAAAAAYSRAYHTRRRQLGAAS